MKFLVELMFASTLFRKKVNANIALFSYMQYYSLWFQPQLHTMVGRSLQTATPESFPICNMDVTTGLSV